jgi:hypothetical protein
VLKFSATSLIFSLSLACFPLVSSAATSETMSSVKSSAKPFRISCSSQDFVGEVRGTYFDYGTSKSVYLKEYRITKAGGSNRHQANVNMTVANFAGSGSKKHNSPDRMRQDGQWHNQTLSVMAAPWRQAQIRVEIIFDKSGSDTKCVGRLNI